MALSRRHSVEQLSRCFHNSAHASVQPVCHACTQHTKGASYVNHNHNHNVVQCALHSSPARHEP